MSSTRSREIHASPYGATAAPQFDDSHFAATRNERHFSVFSQETVPYGVRRYEEQGELVDKLVEHLLTGQSYFLGAEYSIVDIAFYGWYFAAKWAGFDFDGHTNLAAWFERVSDRPAVARGVTIPRGLPTLPPRKTLPL